MDNQNNNLTYLYCVADKAFETTIIQSSNYEFYFIPVKNFFAVVSRVSEKDFGNDILLENVKNLEWLEKFAKQHENIIEYIMNQNITVIPFKFATLFYCEENLESSLAQQETVIKENFTKLKNKEEWGLKIFCNTEVFSGELVKTNQEILQIDNEIYLASPGKAYILKKKRKELLKDVMLKEINIIKSDILKEIEKTTLDTKINKILPKTATARNDEMIFNTVFLIEKLNVPTFIDKICEFKIKGLSFEYSGPWPPYNFIDMQEI